MEFNDVIKQFSERILSLKDTITTEESTKMSHLNEKLNSGLGPNARVNSI